MAVTHLKSTKEFDEAVGSGATVVWVFDQYGANRSFGKKYEEAVAPNHGHVKFYKAGDDDIGDSLKAHGMLADNVYIFKDGAKIGDHREDYNAVDEKVKSLHPSST